MWTAYQYCTNIIVNNTLTDAFTIPKYKESRHTWEHLFGRSCLTVFDHVSSGKSDVEKQSLI